MVFQNQSRSHISPLVVLVVVTIVVIVTWAPQAAGSSDPSTIRISDSKTIYDVLKDHGLPEGLLPKGVRSYSVEEDGSFEVHLDQTCVAKLENQFKFMQKISGKLSFGQIGNMTGIQTQDLFVWLSVKGVRVDNPKSGIIHFNADGVHKQFPLSLFEIPPTCVVVTSTFTNTQVDRVLQYRRMNPRKSGSDVM